MSSGILHSVVRLGCGNATPSWTSEHLVFWNVGNLEWECICVYLYVDICVCMCVCVLNVWGLYIHVYICTNATENVECPAVFTFHLLPSK